MEMLKWLHDDDERVDWILKCPGLTPFLSNLHVHRLIISLGLHEDLLQTQHSLQQIFIYKTSEQKHHQSLLSVNGRFAIRRDFTLMHPISRSKCITPASIKTYILLFGNLFPYIYICISFVSRCIYKVFFKDKVCSQGLWRFWTGRQLQWMWWEGILIIPCKDMLLWGYSSHTLISITRTRPT